MLGQPLFCRAGYWVTRLEAAFRFEAIASMLEAANSFELLYIVVSHSYPYNPHPCIDKFGVCYYQLNSLRLAETHLANTCKTVGLYGLEGTNLAWRQVQCLFV